MMQLSAAAFALMLALWNQGRERQMIRDGSTKGQRNLFHEICGALKIIIAVAIGYYSRSVKMGYICFFVEWFTFDIFNSLFIGQKWYFIGTTARLDILVNKLGKNAGKIKAAACVVIVVALNFIK